MSYLIRSTSRSAAGREIVRKREVPGDTLLIGRDPASDIHLTDLEVTRQHARIQRISPTQIEVEATARLPLTIDGRQSHGRVIDAVQGAEILIGGSRIAIGYDAGTSRITIDIVRIEAPPTSSAEAARRFSLLGVAPSRRLMAWAFALAILAGFLAWPIWQYTHAEEKLTDAQMAEGSVHADRAWSTGRLSNAHAALEQNCKSCHVGAFVAVPDNSCKTCHADVHDHADPARLLAAAGEPTGMKAIGRRISIAFGRDPGRCVDCHLEHQGRGPMMAVSQTLCADCHGGLKAQLPDTTIGNAHDFASAHPQFRPSVMTVPGERPRFTRFSLDDRPRQESGLKFPHKLHMMPSGGAARMAVTLEGKPLACASCHVPDDSGARFKPVSMDGQCQQCHSLALGDVGGTVLTLRHGDANQAIAAIRTFYGAYPKGAAFVQSLRQRPGQIAVTRYQGGGAAAAIRRTFSAGGACYGCHVIKPPSTPGGLDYGIVPVRQQLRFLHKGWFNHQAHSTTPCATCHAEATTSDDSTKLMLPGIQTCRTCHGGDRAAAPLVRSSCVMCHDYHATDGAPKAVQDGPRQNGSVAALKMEWAG